MPFTVPANFIDVFKIGDNINYNLEILRILYNHFESLEAEKTFLIKPIVIINTSIIEAILYDFIQNRMIRANRNEEIRTSLPEVLAAIQGRKFDKFEHYITLAEKYDFFRAKDTRFYDAMRSLRKKRNRVHIQNSAWEKPDNERDLFDERLKILSEKVLEKVLNTMTVKYPRQEEYHGFVGDFHLPWNRHFGTQLEIIS